MWKTNFTALAAVALLVSVPYLISNAADDAPTTAKAPASAAAPAAPTANADYSSADSLYDPAFSRYIDLGMLGHAWDTLDAALLTDCALQLAEGERALYRNHKAITSDQLLDLAAKTAAEKKDTKTLDRLAKIAEGTKNTAALEKITASRKLAGASRKVDPSLSVSATETSPDQLALYQEALSGLRAATILGDQTYLADLEEGLSNKESVLVNLTSQQREHLKKVMGTARDNMPKTDDQPLTDTLSKLKSASRGGFLHNVAGIVNDIHGIVHDTHGHGGHGGGHSWNGGGHHWNGGGHNWNGGGHSWNGGGHHWNGGGHNWNGGGRPNWNGGSGGTWNGGNNWNRPNWNGGGHSWSGGHSWGGHSWNRRP